MWRDSEGLADHGCSSCTVVCDPLGAFQRIALRDDAPALPLRGIAIAQLGDFAGAKELPRKATHTFSPKEPVARASCMVAEAEIALASRDLGWPAKMLDAPGRPAKCTAPIERRIRAVT